ncbi:MAG TPA: dihydrofolate reductase family protein [Chloroflexia bacterium]|jgi:2,5-diamino-6-(ribosylamino)-4(3H)-pyrimidinone 5'-phosphate reductase|nr:dihydrofolate reductase family protein [Chloroflexia bacterium]
MNRPHVLINVAATADGKLDTVEGRGAAISSPRDKERVDRLRAASDAVMVGGHTLLGEDPKLTVKSAALQAERVARGWSRHPAKVGIVSRPDLRADAQFLTAGPARCILFTTAQATATQLAGLRERGAEVYVLGETRVDLPAALEKLQELGVNHLLVEGGATLNFELLRLRLVDEVQIYLAPLIFGGARAPTLAGGAGLPRTEAIALHPTNVEVWDDGGVVLHYAVR